MKIINGEGLLLGRVCSYAAKSLLLGEEVKIVNCEKVWVSGSRATTFHQELIKHERRGYPPRSPKTYKVPHLFVKRTVRGMLPYKTTRGQEAYKRLKCYVGIPLEFQNQKMETIKKANVDKLPLLKQVTVEEICNWLKGTK